jgi:demethylmenaquinone methyltransferase/2-methoxy-6-polyprenyl-1,4-benzoquinol methylase
MAEHDHLAAHDVSPHPVLPAYYRLPDQRAGFVRQLFDDTAPHYDRINEIFSLGSGRRYRRECLARAGLRPGMRVADIAIGTGLVAEEALRIVGNRGEVIGLDLSAGMLRMAREKLSIPLVQGSADRLPFASNSVDFLTLGYALRHVADLKATFGEFHRVLRPGGTVLLLEIARPEKPLTRAVVAGYLGGVVPMLCRWMTGETTTRTLTRYYWDTIEHCVPAAVIVAALSGAAFSDVTTTTALGLLRSYIGRKADRQ